MQIDNGREYQAIGRNTVCFQCVLNGGTATLELKLHPSSEFTVFHTFAADDAVLAELPQCTYRATLTGGATLNMV